jgi:hypothetical protein
MRFIVALLKTVLRWFTGQVPVAPETGDLAATFMRENTRLSPGAKILFSELYRRFVAGLPNEEKSNWRKRGVSASLRGAGFTLRNSNHNALYVMGVEWRD